VIVEFIIEKDGKVSNIKIVHGIGDGCDEEVIKIISLSSGEWAPGKSGGKIVRSKYVAPVFFNLTEIKK
jgi:protein TonB